MKQIDWDLNTLVDVTLLAGLILSVFLIMVGLCWQWLLTGAFGSFPLISAHNLLEYMTYTLQDATREGMGPAALANSGIIVLLLTPFIRVLLSAVFFGFFEHNRIYTAITGFVLILLGLVLFGI